MLEVVSTSLIRKLGGEELYQAYANSDVLVIPSESETFGLLVLKVIVPDMFNETMPIMKFELGSLIVNDAISFTGKIPTMYIK